MKKHTQDPIFGRTHLKNKTTYYKQKISFDLKFHHNIDLSTFFIFISTILLVGVIHKSSIYISSRILSLSTNVFPLIESLFIQNIPFKPKNNLLFSI